MKLLYAEDDPALSEAVVDVLNYYKYSVDAVYDGEDALYYAEHESYDGIILDIMMPKMSGLEVLKKLREKSAAAADRKRNAERMAKGPSKDENLADRFKQ